MSEKTVPTQPHNEPVKPAELDHHVPPNAQQTVAGSGHWYRFPGQSPQAPVGPKVGAPPGPGRARERRNTVRDRVRRRKIRRELGTPDDWAWVIIAAAVLGMTVIMSMTIFFLLQAARGDHDKIAIDAFEPEPTSVLYGQGGILEGTVDTSAGGMLGDGESMIIRPWDGNERFTVLVMGMDKRPGELGTSFRTDTMLLISLEPNTNHIGMLSIPRDLWVDVPGYGLQRVNTAYGLGEYEGPGGGPRLAMQTIQYNLGIRVNEYVVVDFNSFIKVIDLIGGVHVEVHQTIYDPQYPDMNFGYDPFYIEAGWHHMDGATALKYARSRHSTDDIDRAQRQQQVIYALRDQVIAADKIPELAMQAPTIWAELEKGVDTGLSLDQILELAWYAKDIPATNYTNGVLDWRYVTPVTYEGQAILVPNRALIGNLMLEVFGAGYNQ